MCGPLAAVGIASTALGIGGKIAKRKAEKKLAKENQLAALKNHQDRSNALMARNAEIEAADSERAFSAAVEAAKAQGRIAASAGDRGISAGSSERLQRGAIFEIGRQQRLGELQGEAQQEQTNRELEGSQTRFRNEFANAKPPSAASFALGIASTALGGAIDYNDATNGSLFG